MNQGSSDRIPVSSLILFASVVFTLTAYFTFTVLWEVDIHFLWLLAVLGLQFAVLLLGSSKVLTRLGAAASSAIIAVAAYIGAFFFIIPPIWELRMVGAVGGGSAFIFIIASFVAASRVDPVPSITSEPLVIGDLEYEQTVELIKYGEVKVLNAEDTHDPPLTYLPMKEVDVPGHSDLIETEVPPILKDKANEFDELSESKPEQSSGTAEDAPAQDPFELNEVIVTELFDEVPPPASAAELPPRLEPILDDEPIILKSRMRTRYKVLDATSGEHYGTYYGDEGYSTLDSVSLSGLIDSKPDAGELRIVKLDWSNFDEVEVHIKVEGGVPINLDDDLIIGAGESQMSSGMRDDVEEGEGGDEGDEPVAEAVPDSIKTLPEDDLTEEGKAVSPVTIAGPRYLIYDRRTIQPMGEYVPEGARPRIDRLTLYKMFPEYNFKTFEIDSIRWEADEVRIFIKGEKKQSPKSNVQSPKK